MRPKEEDSIWWQVNHWKPLESLGGKRSSFKYELTGEAWEQNSILLLKLWQWGREKQRSRRLERVQGERLCCGLFYLRIREIWVLCAPEVKPVERRKRLKMLSGRWTERSCGWRSQPGKRGSYFSPERRGRVKEEKVKRLSVLLGEGGRRGS